MAGAFLAGAALMADALNPALVLTALGDSVVFPATAAAMTISPSILRKPQASSEQYLVVSSFFALYFSRTKGLRHCGQASWIGLSQKTLSHFGYSEQP